MQSAALALLSLFAASASAVVVPNAAAFCGSASTSSINCYQGVVQANVPSFAGVCTCSCGVGGLPGVDYMAASASSAACTSSFCAAQFPSGCTFSGGGTIGASFQSAASYLAGQQSPITPVLSGPASQCFAYSFTCTNAAVNAGLCDAVMIGATTTAYNNWNSTNGGSCATIVSQTAELALLTSLSVCSTNDCNAPPPPASSASRRAAAAAAALGLAGIAALLL